MILPHSNFYHIVVLWRERHLMQTRAFAFVVALVTASVPGPSTAAMIEGQLVGTVTSYDAFVNPDQVAAAFPLGTPVSAQFRFDDAAYQAPATGFVKIGATAYTVTSVYANGGINVGGQTFGFTALGLTGPSVLSGDPDYLPGNVSFEFGLPYPISVGSTIANYPYASIAVVYETVSQFGFAIDRANLTFTSGNVIAVPEPATWLDMTVGFALLGSLRRRSRAAVLS